MTAYQQSTRKRLLLVVLCIIMMVQTMSFTPVPRLKQPVAVDATTNSRKGRDWSKSFELQHAPPRKILAATKQQPQQEVLPDSKNRRELLLYGVSTALASALSSCFVLTLTQPKNAMAYHQHQEAALVDDTSRMNQHQQGNNNDNSNFEFQIITSLPKGIPKKDFNPNSSLVITVKPAVTYTHQVPKDIADASLAATGHWVPIVLRSRQKFNKLCSQQLVSFCDNDDSKSSSTIRHITTTLTLEDVTSEAGTNLDWWRNLPLIVTAKLDADGKDSTVNSMDLVGCRIIPNNGGLEGNSNKQLTMPLQRRGLCSDLLLSVSKKAPLTG